MSSIIELLEEKNYFLKKFLELNQSELKKVREKNYDTIDQFYNARESLLSIVKKIDEMIEISSAAKDQALEYSAKDKVRIVKAFDEKESYVQEILAHDLEILSNIELEKSEIIRQLSSVKVAKKAVGAYKSGDEKSQLDETV